MKKRTSLFLILAFLTIWIGGCAGMNNRGMVNQPAYEPGVSWPIDLKHWTP